MSHWAPLATGTAAILGIAAWITVEEPSPGALAAAHSGLERLSDCGTCHAEEGLTAGCLGCHVEIGSQLAERTGYHASVEGDCEECHPEHNGAGFALMEGVAWDREAFRHGHVEFALEGRHDDLGCDDCHGKATFTRDGRTRTRTFLGLDQACVSCHEDVHAGGVHTDRCEQCHGQEHFRPADHFDHAQHFPLEGGHAQAVCNGCHLQPEGEGLPFDRVRGKLCRECHEDPHRARLGEECESCHASHEPLWAAGAKALTPEAHARTGFALAAPHAEVACEGCHAPGPPYADRFKDPPRGEESCQSCHEDVHRGQFGARACLACHERTHFDPPRYGRAEHTTFELRGAHARAECQACHTGAPRVFVGTARDCRGCHEDVHRGQFRGKDCSACHGEETFLPPRYDVGGHTAFPLQGAHMAVSCRACHKKEKEAPRRFEGTAKECKACHADPHGAQFAKETREKDCTACHRADAGTFRIRPFDHAKRAGYPLLGAHAEARCAECHRQEGAVRAYRGVDRSCAACHTDAHRGQFEDARCDRCHLPDADWKVPAFDHARTRFPLDGTHRKVACAGCHPGVRQPDGSTVVQYRPLGTECGDCHDFKKR